MNKTTGASVFAVRAAGVVAAWADLLAAIRAGVVALVNAGKGSGS